MSPAERWESAFTIMRDPLVVSTITALFPLSPVEAFNSNERVLYNERYRTGLCEYRLPTECDRSTFLTTLSAWLDLLEPHRTILLQLHAQQYECFLEIWTSAPLGIYELSFACLQRLTALAIDLQLSFGTDDET